MTKKTMIGLVVALIILIASIVLRLTQDDVRPSLDISPIPVQTTLLEKETIDKLISYQGVIASDRVETISFKSTARLDAIYGDIGSEIDPGTLLIQMNTQDLELALEAAKQQYNAAVANYKLALNGARQEDLDLSKISAGKALQAVKYLEDQVTKMKLLNEEGIVSDAELEDLELQVRLAKADYDLAHTSSQKAINGSDQELIEVARAQMNLAAVDIDLQEALIEDAQYRTDGSKVIVQQLYEEGELVAAGYPVLVLRGMQQVVEIGVSIKDIDQLVLGQKVMVSNASKEVEGSIRRIAEIPDSDHYLYEVEVLVTEPIYKVGEIVSCEIKVGEEVGMLVPLSTIKKDNFDYIYVAVDGLVDLQKVEIIGIKEDQAIVSGLEDGVHLIISNLNKIEGQSIITIVEE